MPGLISLSAVPVAGIVSRAQMAQNAPVRGSLSGAVTADQGSVVGFRVTASLASKKRAHSCATVRMQSPEF